MLTPYPQIVEYNEAVQHPATAFKDPELRQGRVKVNALGLPVALSGGFALTYMMTAPGRTLAVRCFHREIPAAQQKYAAIARTVQALRSPYFVGFEYLPDGIRIRGGFYPVLKMDWAEGDPLGIWLDRNVNNRRGLERLRSDFVALAAFLEKHGIAHGDIQNGNVIISPAGLKLVDYDGVYVPGMPADFGSEAGHKHFQHPDRTPAHFGPTVDRFSFIAVDLSLAALIEDPGLHRRFRHGGETILFRANDFADPDRSEVFRLLRQMPALKTVAENFAAICRTEIAAVPTLAEFRAGSNIPSPKETPPQLARRAPAARYIAPYAVLRAEDFAAVSRCVGHRVELVGRVDNVRRGIGDRGERRGKPCVFVNFAPLHQDGTRVTIWVERQAQLVEAPDERWAGRWVSIIGLVEPPYRERHFFRQYTHIGISTEDPGAIEPLSEEEARFRLRRGERVGGPRDIPAARSAEAAPAPAAGGNRQLVQRLLRKGQGSARPSRPAPSNMPRSSPPPARPSAAPFSASRSNRDIVRTLRPAIATPPPSPAQPNPASPAAHPQRRRPLPKTGSVVIHPRTPAAQAPPPPPPAASSPPPNAAAEPPERRVLQRVLRFIGFDA